MKTQTSLAVLKEHTAELEAILNLTHDTGNMAAVVANELEYLNIHSMRVPDLAKANPQTIVQCVKSVMKWNLSFDPDAGLVYVKTRNHNFGTKENPSYMPIMEIQRTANGNISVARQLGRILDIKRPAVQKDQTGKVTGVSVDILLPSHPSPRWETMEFDESDFERWRTASHRQNSRGKNDATSRDYSNPLYRSFKGGIDPEFARAKSIQHSLKKLGINHNEIKSASVPKIEPIIDPVIANREAEEYSGPDDTVEYTVISSEHSHQNQSEGLPTSEQL